MKAGPYRVAGFRAIGFWVVFCSCRTAAMALSGFLPGKYLLMIDEDYRQRGAGYVL